MEARKPETDRALLVIGSEKRTEEFKELLRSSENSNIHHAPFGSTWDPVKACPIERDQGLQTL